MNQLVEADLAPLYPSGSLPGSHTVEALLG